MILGKKLYFYSAFDIEKKVFSRKYLIFLMKQIIMGIRIFWTKENVMESAIQDFLIYMTEVKKASINTVSSYKNDLNKLVKYLGNEGIFELEKMSETCLNSYILSMEREGKSPATVSRCIASMKAFTFFMIKRGRLNFDPTERMKAPKVEKKPPVILSIEEVDTLLNLPDTSTNKGKRDKAMLELLYATGIRVSELISLTLEDVNIKNKYIVCKSDSKERVIPFGNAAKNAIKDYYGIREILIEDGASDYAFTNLQGEQMSRQGFWKIIKGYGKCLGLKIELTPQILRNSFTVHLMENGADVYSVQELLGNADISAAQGYMQDKKRKLLEVYTSSHPRA